MEGSGDGAATAAGGGDSGGTSVAAACTCAEWGIACSCDGGGASDASGTASSTASGTASGTASAGSQLPLALLRWADPRMQEQVGRFEDEDEDLFVAVGGDGRLKDGLVDYGDCDFSFGSWTMPHLKQLMADWPCARALRRDCMLCCYPFSDKAFWLPANLQPRCTLEALALAIFEEHTAGVVAFDRERSGCEWWAQIRRPGEDSETIGFHWDKDEQ